MIRLAIIAAAVSSFLAFTQDKPKPRPTPDKPKPTEAVQPEVTTPVVQEPKPDTKPEAKPDGKQDPKPEVKKEPETHTVAKGPLTLALDLDGVFEAIDPFEAKIKFEAFAGELIVASAAANGASVKKGDEILKLDSPVLKKQLEAAENELKAAQANLVRSEGMSKLGAEADALALAAMKMTLKNAEANHRYWKEMDSANMMKMAEMSIQGYRDYLSDKQEELDQLKKMYSSEELTNATAEIVVRRAERALKRLVIYVEMAGGEMKKTVEHEHPMVDKQITAALEQAKLALAQLELTQAQAKVTREVELARARATHAQQEEQTGKLRRDWELLSVKSTIDGTLLYGSVAAGAWTGHDVKILAVGEKLTAGAKWMTVFAPGKLKVRTDLPESQRFWITAGLKALVTPVAAPEAPVDGACGQIAWIAGGKGFELTIDLPGADPRFVPGMKAGIHIDVAELKDILTIPNAAIANGRVWVKKDGKEEPKRIVTGRTDGKVTEVKSGLVEGDVILAAAKK